MCHVCREQGAQSAIHLHVSSHPVKPLLSTDLLGERMQAHLRGQMKQSRAGWHSTDTHHKQAAASATQKRFDSDHSFQSPASAKVM